MKSFTHPVVPNLYEVIKKKKKKTSTINCLVTHILQNIFFYVPTEKNVYRFGTWRWV